MGRENRGTAFRSREAVILAGGFGTRLAHVVPDVCKPMAPVSGIPFLRYVLDQLDDAGFARVIIADGYRREQIEDYFQGTYLGLEIDYSSEDTPLLTGGALKKALAQCSQNEVFVLNGDTWFDVDFSTMEKALKKNSAAKCCVAIKELENFDRYGILDIDDRGVVRSFREKSFCVKGRINGGVYLIKKNALLFEPDVFSLEDDWFKQEVNSGALITCESKGDFIDIGVPEDYQKAQTMFKGKIKSYSLALFDRDGTINEDIGHLHRIEDVKLLSSTLSIMRRYSADPDWKIAVVTNQAGIAKGMYGISEMRNLHRLMANLLFEFGVKVDAWYFCPHHPDYTGDCACRKPKSGMLRRAMRDFGADSSRCVMYGDSIKDKDAAFKESIAFHYIKRR